MGYVHPGDSTSIPAAELAAGKIMLINCDRIAYAGLLGTPGQRNFGSLTVYVSLDRPFRVCTEERAWQEADLAVVAPYMPHQVMSEDRNIGVVMIEPESVDMKRLPPLLQPHTAHLDSSAGCQRMRDALHQLSRQKTGSTAIDFDQLFFGEHLASRVIDRRIARIVRQICAQPCELHDAQTSASHAGLSFSRFLHLFADELGVSFRRYRAWKRARNILPYVTQVRSLTDIALEMGYPDSSHFSHSIRNVYGLKPKDIFAGSKRLSVIAQQAPAPSLSYAAWPI